MRDVREMRDVRDSKSLVGCGVKYGNCELPSRH
jgi:hypothetical protein